MSTNLRIIYNNAADRAVLSASSQASTSLGVANLKTDRKTQVWRSTAAMAQITATWPSAEAIAGVALPFCNLTETASVRVRGYAEPGDSVPRFDTGFVAACPGPVLGNWDWGSIGLAANAYARGSNAYGRVWIPVPAAVKKLLIDIDATGNPSGYIEVGRLVCGAYWSPQYNASFGASITAVDTSTHFRNAANDLMTDRGMRHRVQTFDLAVMDATDRSALWNIVGGNGMSKPLFFSLYPDHGDSCLEQAHQMYCKLNPVKPFVTPLMMRYATTIDLEEI